MEPKKEVKVEDPTEVDLFNDESLLADDEYLGNMLPNMNVNSPVVEQKEPCIVGDETLLGIYDEILDNCRKDRQHIDDVLANFMEMVFNDGDSTKESKEALVNLLKCKSDVADKMAKVADLMTRIKLKDRDTFPRYLAATQHNTVNIESNKREILKSLKAAKKKKE